MIGRFSQDCMHIEESDIGRKLNVSIAVLEGMLKRVKEFKHKFENNLLVDGDSYNDFDGIAENGTNRSGVDTVTYELCSNDEMEDEWESDN